MKSRTIMYWLLALGITLASAIYQRRTGPTYPLQGSTSLDDLTISYVLPRSHGGETDKEVVLEVPDPEVSGLLVYRRYGTNDSWTEIPFARSGNKLVAHLPKQPPAGKLEYHVKLMKGASTVLLPDDRNAVIRFKGEVPLPVLVPHIVFMFAAMLVSTRAGLTALSSSSALGGYALWATTFLFIGGLVFGPIMQKYALGLYWTGIPFGWDLTDNKTLVAFLAWVGATISTRRGQKPRVWVLLASIITLVIFAIPHSLHGTELDYSALPGGDPS